MYTSESAARDAIRDAQNKCNAILNRATADKRSLRAEEQAEFDAAIATRSAAEAELPSFESRGRKATANTVDAATEGAREAAALAFRGWACGSRASSSMREAAARFGIDVGNPELDLRALSVGTTTAGGSAVGNEAIRAFDLAEKYHGPIRNLATIFQTVTGAPLPCPTVDDTANTAEIVGEGSAITTTADPLFGSVTLHPFKYVSKAVIVSMELLQDASIPLPEVLGGELGKRVARKQNTDMTSGAGTTLPFGIAVQASLGKTATATNAITWDEVYDLQASVDTAYAARPSAGFMMHPSTANYLRKLKDSQNRYLWELGIQEASPAQGNVRGEAGRIAGYPVFLNPDMDSALSTNKRLVLFGDFKSYWIQDAGPAVLVRADELRLLTGESVFVAFRRTDGALVNSAAVKYLRTA